MTQNYLTVVNTLNQFAENHPETQRFKCSFFEQLDNFSTSGNSFPILYAIPNDISMDENIDNMSFRVYCLDILQKDRENESAILNTTYLVLRDLVNWIRKELNLELNLLNTPRAFPVNNFLVDFTTGWYIDIELEVTANTSDCVIPFLNNFQISGMSCDVSFTQPYLTCSTVTGCTALQEYIIQQINSQTGATANFYTTASTLSGDTVYFDRNDQFNAYNFDISGATSITNLQSVVYANNQLLSGSISYLSGLTFDITELTYLIGGQFYTAATSQVTVLSGGTQDRIDTIFADISGNTGVIQGEESDNPAKPAVDPQTQIEVSFVSIPAGSSTPAINSTLVYDEFLGPPTEWTVNNFTVGRVFPNNTGTTYSGTKAIRFLTATNGSLVEFSSSTIFDTTVQNTIQFAIRNSSAWPSTIRLNFAFFSSSNVQIGSIVQLYNGRFGFSSTNTTGWQVISIPISNFALTNPFVSKLRVTVSATSLQAFNGFLDRIQIVQGLPTVTLQPNWRYMAPDSGSTLGAVTANDTLRLSGGTNITSFSSGANNITFNLDNNIRLNSVSANTVSASTYYSGSTSLTNVITTIVTGITSNIPPGFSGWTASSGVHSIVANNGTGNSAGTSFGIVGGKSNLISGNSYSNNTSASFIGGGKNNIALDGAYGTSAVIVGGNNNFAGGYYSTGSFVGGGTSNKASGSFSIINGGLNNITDSYYSVIAGGRDNLIQSNCQYTFILGGRGNNSSGPLVTLGGAFNIGSAGYATILNGSYQIASGQRTFIGNGDRNNALGTFATVVNGNRNSATTDYSIIVGGKNNLVTGAQGFIGGGNGNINNGYLSTIGAGYQNKVEGFYSSVLGGYRNSATTAYAAVLGGQRNLAYGFKSAIIGGSNNIASDNNALIGTGDNNLASNNQSSVLNGNSNSATSFFSTVINGSLNLASNFYSIVTHGYNTKASGQFSLAGGYLNTASGKIASVINGKQNTASGYYSLIAAGNQNQASGYFATIVGGNQNQATTQASFIGNGLRNLVSGNSYSSGGYGGSVVVGGSDNIALDGAYGTSSVVVGGNNNFAGGYYSTATFVGGGINNKAFASFSVINGGKNNTSDSYYSIINGGKSNNISTNCQGSSILGGYYNKISGPLSIIGGARNSGTTGYATVLNGSYNLVSGQHSSVINGRFHTITGTYSSILAGRNITATANDAAYVPFLYIISASTNNTLDSVLVRDTTGEVKVRSISGITSGTTAGQIDAISFTGTEFSYDVVFTNPFIGATYTPIITGSDVRSWTVSNVSTTGFRINSNSTTTITGVTYWSAIKH